MPASLWMDLDVVTMVKRPYRYRSGHQGKYEAQANPTL